MTTTAKPNPATTAVYLQLINADLIAALKADDEFGITKALTELRTFASLTLKDYTSS